MSDIWKTLFMGVRMCFRKPITTKLPKQNIERCPHFRRFFHIDNQKNNGKCVGCKICENICPCSAIIIIDKNNCKFDKNRCAYCGLCEKTCPTNAIKFTKDKI